MEELIRALASDLGSVVRTGAPVTALKEAGWDAGKDPASGARQREDAKHAEHAVHRKDLLEGLAPIGSSAANPSDSLLGFVPQDLASSAAASAASPADPFSGSVLHEARGGNRRYRLQLNGGEWLQADAVVLAGPAAASARIVASLDPEMATTLARIESAPLAVVCLGYAEAKLPRPLAGFGFLVPPGEGPRILGALWDSSIYLGHAPAGKALVRAMIGGARDPQAATLTDDALLDAVRKDLSTTMGLDASPDFVRIFRHPLGIPQYKVGHLERLRKIEDRARLHPGLFLAGNSYRGVSINSCVAESGEIARRVLDDLGRNIHRFGAARAP